MALEGRWIHSVPVQNIIPEKKNVHIEEQYTPLPQIPDTWPSTSRDIYKIYVNYNH